jgi:DNA invertase Pin-like site-specific DNA recombinase
LADTPKRAALYLRRSARSRASQIFELDHVARRAGWEVVARYLDLAISEAKVGAENQSFERMLRYAARRQFDVLVAWSIDHLGSTLQEVAVTLTHLQDAGVDLYLKEPAIDTTTPSGRVLFQTIGMFADFERALARRRVQDGIDRAKRAGKRFGRPSIDPQRAEAIAASLATGLSIRKTAKLHGVGISSVQRLKKAAGPPGR